MNMFVLKKNEFESDVSQTKAFLFNFLCVGEKPKLICSQSSKKHLFILILLKLVTSQNKSIATDFYMSVMIFMIFSIQNNVC